MSWERATLAFLQLSKLKGTLLEELVHQIFAEIWALLGVNNGGSYL